MTKQEIIEFGQDVILHIRSSFSNPRDKKAALNYTCQQLLSNSDDYAKNMGHLLGYCGYYLKFEDEDRRYLSFKDMLEDVKIKMPGEATNINKRLEGDINWIVKKNRDDVISF